MPRLCPEASWPGTVTRWFADRRPKRPRPGGARRCWPQRGAITVEYALVMVLAAAILIGVEENVFQPMVKDILKNFMEFIVKPYP
ncbi:MAG TPA: Flp family type IVb pilin [Solidesulfovibrio sp.]|jgi:Flp pilus assembly pilin Flp|nr:Flp family type IVb pilin [Solidesulfovibrio sp.]